MKSYDFSPPSTIEQNVRPFPSSIQFQDTNFLSIFFIKDRNKIKIKFFWEVPLSTNKSNRRTTESLCQAFTGRTMTERIHCKIPEGYGSTVHGISPNIIAAYA